MRIIIPPVSALVLALTACSSIQEGSSEKPTVISQGSSQHLVKVLESTGSGSLSETISCLHRVEGMVSLEQINNILSQGGKVINQSDLAEIKIGKSLDIYNARCFYRSLTISSTQDAINQKLAENRSSYNKLLDSQQEELRRRQLENRKIQETAQRRNAMKKRVEQDLEADRQQKAVELDRELEQFLKN